MVKQAGVVAWLGGIAALIGLVTWSGLGAVGQAVSSVGWGILLVVLARAVALVVAGVGWWLLFPSNMRPQLRTCVLLRFVREATNVLLPLAQVGGDLIGAGLLTLYAVPGALAAASVIVDVLIQAATQFLFAIFGLLALIALEASEALARSAAVGIALAALLLAGFYLAQRRGAPQPHVPVRIAALQILQRANYTFQRRIAGNGTHFRSREFAGGSGAILRIAFQRSHQ